MQFTTTALLTSFLTTLSLGSPTGISHRSATELMTVQDTTWTIQSLIRTCNDDNTSCTWSFGINTNAGQDVVPVKYTVTGDPASQMSVGPTYFGDFKIESTWSNGGPQGDPNAAPFTTLSVVNTTAVPKEIAYPAYRDADLAGGIVVSPDRSYPVQNLY